MYPRLWFASASCLSCISIHAVRMAKCSSLGRNSTASWIRSCADVIIATQVIPPCKFCERVRPMRRYFALSSAMCQFRLFFCWLEVSSEQGKSCARNL